jgi:two-component system OmpR family sensor kinase
MQLQRRLTWFTLTLTIVVSLLLGITLIETSHSDAIQRTDKAITEIKNSIDESSGDKIITALSLVRGSSLSPILLLIDEIGESTVIFDAADEESNLNLDKLKLTSENILINIPDGYRSVSSLIEGDSSLVILENISEFDSQRKANYLSLLFFVLISALISQFILRKIISRDVSREAENIRLNEKLNFEMSKRNMLLEFISDASHELRTPLTIIKGYLSLAKRDSSISNRETFEKLELESSRLERNIEGLLTVLEFESVSESILEEINLSFILENEFSTFAQRESSREISFTIAQGIYVLASEELILKLVRNALLNITRHTPKSASVSLKLEQSSNLAMISIEDSAPLNSEQSMQIEDYIKRFNNNRAFEKGGSGLGFSIMNSAIKKMSGTLRVFKSELGGFGVSMELPISKINVTN